MIELTIKTLDSKDHRFSVDDEITVQQLKEKVLEQLGIETGLQRLIFCGRVLQDDRKLAAYGVHGKVVHMVQRPPPCVMDRQTPLREREREWIRNNFPNYSAAVAEPINLSPVHLNHISQQQIRRLMALAATAHGIEIEEQPGPNLSPTASRLEFLRRLIMEIRTNLDALKASESNGPQLFSTDDPLESTSSGAFRSVPEEVMCHIHQRPLLYQIDHGLGASRQGRGRRIRSMRSVYHTPPRDFGQLVEELHELDGEFAPFREIYINTLREASFPDLNLFEYTLQRRQRTADLCAELYHTFSHAYHTVSDVSLLMANGNSRLTSEALMRHPLPVHAHINVVQTSPTRRPVNATTTNNGMNPTLSADGQEAQTSSALAGRNTTQPTVNINIQPDPVTYQVEIETAVPIPINIENGFVNGTNTNTGHQNQHANQQQSHSDGAPSAQDGLAERRQVMIEFENLFRGLGQATGLGGVEVVMSMEEIPQANGSANNNIAGPMMGGSLQTEGGGNPPRNVLGSQMYLAQTADLLQNIVASVFRQGFVPGMEGVVHAQVQQFQGQSQSQTQGQGQGQGQSQSQSQSQSQTQSQGQSQPQTQTPTQSQENQTRLQNQSQIPNQTQTRERSQENQGNTEQNANANSANQPRQQTRNRNPRVRSQTVSIFNLVYDRFLPCDSQHARQQLQRRREESILAGGPRLRDNSSTRIQNNVETLFERFDRQAVDEESLLIATMVTLREATSFSSGRTLVPDELLPLRQRLQVYMRDLMQGEYEVGTQEQLADLIFERHSEFVSRILSITPMRQHVDVIASMKAVFIRFLNEAMTVLDMENNDVFSRRFRIVFPRMFYELCGVISYCSLEGVEGLRKIYRSFLSDLIKNVDEPVRDLLYSLAMENLNAAIIRVEANKIHYPQFIRRKDQQPCSSRSSGNFTSRYYGMLSSIESPKSTESPKVADAEGTADTEVADETDDTEEIEETEDVDESEDTEEIEEIEETDKSTPMELSPQLEQMQTSPAAPVPDSTEPAAKSTVVAPSDAPVVSATGTCLRTPDTQNCVKENEELSTAKDELDNESTVENVESQECVSTTNNSDNFGANTSEQHALEEQSSQVVEAITVDDGPNWPEPTGDIGGTYDPHGRVSAMHNRGRFRKELLRYPGSGQNIAANVASSSIPSPPLVPVIAEDPSGGRANSVRGRFRREIPPAVCVGQSTESSLETSDQITPANEFIGDRYNQNGRVSAIPSRGRSRTSRPHISGSPITPDSSDNIRFVPPAQIAQHWGEEWVPTFTHDLQQQSDSDEPYSDAYLSGMPPKKRRRVRQSRPPATINAFFNDSVNDVSDAAAVQGQELNVAFREHMRSIARARAAVSRNYEPRRYAATARFLNQSKTNARKTPEKSE